MKKLLLVSLITVLAGCVSNQKSEIQPIVDRLNNLEFPPKPSVKEVEGKFKEAAKRGLKDPYSVRDFAVIEEPFRCIFAADVGWTTPRSNFKWPSWCVIVEFNSKNSMGAYVGIKKKILQIDKDEATFISRGSFNEPDMLSDGWVLYDEYVEFYADVFNRAK